MSLEIETHKYQMSFLWDINHADVLARHYDVPIEDVLLIALNLSGIHYKNVENDRGRFQIFMPSGRNYKVAMTITNSKLTNFSHDGKKVFLGNDVIATSGFVEKDTCTDSYWRNRNHLTLNSNFRSICHGCLFCGTYSLERSDTPLVEEELLKKRALELREKVGNFRDLEAIGVVTGCFSNEESTVNHVSLIRKVFSALGFNGEIQYVGSQIRSNEAFKRLTNEGRFSLYLTLEVFDRREMLMRKQKSSLSLEDAKRVLDTARKNGAETSFLYIAGLDSFATINRELPKFVDLVTRLPLIQTYQLYKPEQISLRSKDAYTMDYYLSLRFLSESIFPTLKPVVFENYRGLWFSEYAGKKL